MPFSSFTAPLPFPEEELELPVFCTAIHMGLVDMGCKHANEFLAKKQKVGVIFEGPLSRGSSPAQSIPRIGSTGSSRRLVADFVLHIRVC